MPGSTTAFPFSSAIRGFARFLRFTARVVREIAPQLLISALALWIYQRAGYFPREGASLHLVAIALLQVLFYGFWSQVVGPSVRPGPSWIRLLFSFSQLLKGLALNAVYVASYQTQKLWHAYLSWDNLTVSAQHFGGFRQTFGWVVPAAIIGLVLVGFILWGVAYRLAPVQLHRLATHHHGRTQAIGFAVLTAALGLTFWFLYLHEKNTREIFARDPLIAFWQPDRAQAAIPTPVMLEEQRAADFVPPNDFHRRNVILITIDCLRRDHLPFHGYHRNTSPYLLSLIQQGRASYVDLAVSNGNYSAAGKLSLLSSRQPIRQQPYSFKIHDALKRAGYRTHLIAAGDNTHLQDMRRHYGPNFDVFFDGLSPSNYGVNDDRRILERLETLPASEGQPAFFYFHLMSAHPLGIRLPEMQRWQPSALVLEFIQFITGRVDQTMVENTYDNGIAMADHYLEAMLARLQTKGYLRDSLVVILGDHGEGLGERGIFGHFGYNYMEDIGIPIIFVDFATAPFQPPKMASQIDIAPTVFALLRLTPPRQWEGRSLLPGAGSQVLFSECFRNNEEWRTTLREHPEGIFKYFHIRSASGETRELLFNLTTDPREKTDLSGETALRPLLTDLREVTRQHFAPRPPSAASPRQIAQ